MSDVERLPALGEGKRLPLSAAPTGDNKNVTEGFGREGATWSKRRKARVTSLLLLTCTACQAVAALRCVIQNSISQSSE